MLWYKAWLETRSRFLVSLIGMVALCSYWVFHEDGLSAGRLEWYYHASFTSQRPQSAGNVWVLAVILLMMGGLLRGKVERQLSRCRYL